MEKKYLKEIEAIAKKFDYWDDSKSPYAFLVSYENDSSPGVSHKFITKRMKGGNAFRECVAKMLNNFTPDVIIVEEFTGVKGNPLSQYPVRIRLSDDNKDGNLPSQYAKNPVPQVSALDNVFEGLSGIEGFEGVKSGLGALLAFERERNTKDMMIDRLNYDQKFREFEMKAQVEKLEEQISRLSTENTHLKSQVNNHLAEIEGLEQENEELKSENEKYKPNKLIKDVGIGALTNVAMQLATKSPVLKGLLGLDEETAETPSSPSSSSVGFVQMDDSTLTESQKQIKRAINEIAQALTTWPVSHIDRFTKIMAYVEDNEERQVDLIEYINESLEQENEG
jgi:hypothetical protein